MERRLVLTRGYLPTGFKSTDFSHLGEGSYCFCSRCRARLHPRRTQAEKLAARLAAMQSRLIDADLPAELADIALEATSSGELAEDSSQEVASNTSQTINVEELELAPVDVEDIEAEGVKLGSEDDSLAVSEEDA